MSTFDSTPNGYTIRINVNGFEPDEVQIQTDNRYQIIFILYKEYKIKPELI